MSIKSKTHLINIERKKREKRNKNKPIQLDDGNNRKLKVVSK